MDWLTKIMKNVYSYSTGSGFDGVTIIEAVAAQRAQKLYYARQEALWGNK